VETHRVTGLLASNTKTKSKTLGDVELKYVSLDDFEIFVKFLDKAKDDKDFAIQMLHHQLVAPKLTLEEFSKIPDEELRKLAREFVRNQQYLFKYFKETTDAGFFANFRNAIRDYHLKEVKPLKAVFAPSILSTKNIFQNFENKYKNIIGQSSYITESISGINSAAKAFKELQLNVSQSMKPLIEQYQLNGSFLSKILTPQINGWQNWVNSQKILFNSHKNLWQNFKKQYDISVHEAIKILKKYKWFITPSMPINFIFIVVKVGRKRGNQRKAMNKLFIDYFTRDNFANLKCVVHGWGNKTIFKPRMRIFRNCISVLQTSRKGINSSEVILPTLIAQIDGIQKEFMKQKGLSFDPKKRKWKDTKGDVVKEKEWFKAQTSNDKLDDLTNDIFLNILFQKALPGQPLAIPFTFNRHKIMHGESLKYGRIDNTIRAFLILDFLATLSSRKSK